MESHVRMQLNPELLNDRMYRAVVRELTAKGLREVQAEENPDLVLLEQEEPASRGGES